ncbi:hypothetical protein BCD67_09710 [Oscillatoriales cyanobacterium USR001]|nr:hypothetical protein BCD67_09710 [Oscillatoriales cyanobacterium USR001]
MVNTTNNSQYFPDFQTQTELEILETIIQAEIPYPWNPAQSDSEAYFTALEQELSVTDLLSDADFAQGSQRLFTQLDILWSATNLQKSLLDKFTTVPQDFLTKIAQNVQKVIVEYQSLADRMVQSTLEILPQWSEEDLQVLARPLAYAMRNAELDLDVSPVKSWEELSEIEQARMSLAIARYAIDRLALISDNSDDYSASK